MNTPSKKYRAVVIGASSGGMNALKTLLPSLPAGFPLPLIIVQHIGPFSDSVWIEILDKMCALKVREASEKDKIEPGTVFIAPPNYHLLIEKDETFSLSADVKVNFARPSIDVLFETAAFVFGSGLIGILLTGSNSDGALGIKAIKEHGGITVAQDPATAESPYMPAAAIATGNVDYVLSFKKIIDLLIQCNQL